ncbi:MAG: APC family permease [Flavobacteriales bacterium]|nr:APC family permease [Flavobacteriales bacterium]MCX7768136.1 APC family permease [Flavobacteriales bacterium]MDW8409572.1 amino acid permease [Flavobacteriales bacterium]
MSDRLNLAMFTALGVGMVISGNYFGWNLGLEKAGFWSYVAMYVPVVVMYWFFSLAYAELACAIPKAGGGFEYALKAFGPKAAFLCGFFQIVEFILAAPAIALGMSYYLHHFFPFISSTAWAVSLYVLFSGINVIGIRFSATVELLVTLLALLGLLFFYGYSFREGISVQNFQPLEVKPLESLASAPFIIWFFLAIEGLGNLAEDVQHPERNILRGFSLALTILSLCSLLTLTCAVGLAGNHEVVYFPGRTEPSDSPLLNVAAHRKVPSALAGIFTVFGLIGLSASFNGILLASAKLLCNFAGQGFAPAFLCREHPQSGVPRAALLVNSTIGLLCVILARSEDMITLSALGALGLYILSMTAFMGLRIKAPTLSRPFRFKGGIPAAVFVIMMSLIVVVGLAYHYREHIFVILLAGLASGSAFYLYPRKNKK